jgi:hypothetical protein
MGASVPLGELERAASGFRVEQGSPTGAAGGAESQFKESEGV